MDVRSLYVAKVVDNDDTNHPDDPGKQNRIKIRVDAFMSGFAEDHLPWARPASSILGGGSSEFGSSFIPEMGSKVWVFFENRELRKNAFYIADLSLKGVNTAELFESKVKSEIEGFSSSYPDVKFIHLKNGINIALSSGDKPEISIYHPNGSYFFINDKGEIRLKNKDKIIIIDSSGIFAGEDGKTPDKVISSTKLKTYLSTIVGNLGAPLFPTVQAEDLEFDDFFGGI